MMLSQLTAATFSPGGSHSHCHVGKGMLLAKIDLHQAYRMVPVHADDHPLLGIQWQDITFIDMALLAPKIFSAFANITWTTSSSWAFLKAHHVPELCRS